jgi:hypothetical protein
MPSSPLGRNRPATRRPGFRLRMPAGRLCQPPVGTKPARLRSLRDRRTPCPWTPRPRPRRCLPILLPHPLLRGQHPLRYGTPHQCLPRNRGTPRTPSKRPSQTHRRRPPIQARPIQARRRRSNARRPRRNGSSRMLGSLLWRFSWHWRGQSIWPVAIGGLRAGRTVRYPVQPQNQPSSFLACRPWTLPVVQHCRGLRPPPLPKASCGQTLLLRRWRPPNSGSPRERCLAPRAAEPARPAQTQHLPRTHSLCFRPPGPLLRATRAQPPACRLQKTFHRMGERTPLRRLLWHQLQPSRLQPCQAWGRQRVATPCLRWPAEATRAESRRCPCTIPVLRSAPAA